MALKRITHPEAAGVLARYANDQDDSVRFLAAGLGGGPAARPPAAVPDEEEEEEAAER
jgi:hypothetical protein